MTAPLPAVAVIGGAVGFVAGLFGAGGSSLATPLLVAAGAPPVVAVASPLPASIPATVVAAAGYWREGLRRPRAIRYGVGFGVPAAVLGALATRWVAGSALVVLTDLLIAGLGVRVLLSRPVLVAPPPGTLPRRRLAVLSIVVGLVAGLLGNSGGALLAPAYVTLLRLPVKVAFGTSLLVASAIAVPGTVVHGLLGHLDPPVAVTFAVAAVPLSGLGSRLARRLNTAPLTRAYGVALTALGVAFLVLAAVTYWR